jgi:hypothetical protein
MPENANQAQNANDEPRQKIDVEASPRAGPLRAQAVTDDATRGLPAYSHAITFRKASPASSSGLTRHTDAAARDLCPPGPRVPAGRAVNQGAEPPRTCTETGAPPHSQCVRFLDGRTTGARVRGPVDVPPKQVDRLVPLLPLNSAWPHEVKALEPMAATQAD